VFENRVLRRILRPKRDEVTREWRKPRNKELNDLRSSPNTVWVIKWKIMRWAGHVASVGETRGVYRVLVRKPEGKRPLGRTEGLQMCINVSMFVTGHGKLRSYFHRFKIIDDPTFLCKSSLQTADHLLSDC
jgi:hypothetical protein